MLHKIGKVRVLGAAVIAASLLLVPLAASTVFANVSSPTITVHSTSGSLSVSADGTWSKSPSDNHYVGWAVSWGDGGAYALSNGITTVHFATNAVSPGPGGTRMNVASGSWDGGSHTYAAAGTYQVCVLMYDLQQNWPNDNSKNWIATGSNGGDHNADNTMENPGAFSAATSCANVTVGLNSQTITFGAAPTGVTVGASGKSVSAAASSGLAVTYSSTTPLICSANSGTGALTLLAMGTCTIAANQAGNGTFAAAPQVTQDVTVGLNSQTITFGALADKTYGDPSFTLTASASSLLQVSFDAAGPCTLSGNTLTITGVGSCSVTASQAGDGNWTAAAPVTRTFSIAPAMLTVTANDASRSFGTANPTFTATITGFVNGETSSVVSGSASL